MLNIKTYNSNWEIFKNGELLASIQTDLDNVNSEIYTDVKEIEADFIESIQIAISEEEKAQIRELVDIHFSHLF